MLHQSIRMQNFLFTETQRKRKYNVCSTLGKNFRYYSSCPSTEDHFFDEPTSKKMRQDLKHSVEKRQQYSKNTYVQASHTRAVIAKTKHTTTDPANNSKVKQEEQQPGIQTKELKVMKHTKRLERSSLVLLLREKANSYCAGNISNYYENWRSITSDKYIQGIVQNGLLLSFNKDQLSKALFEFPRTKAETNVLETDVEKLLKKGVISSTKIQPDDYFSNLFAYLPDKRKMVVTGPF